MVKQRTKAALNPGTIARAGLAVIDAEGARALSMRAVAAELGVSAMALYHHVADRSALVTAMVDASLAEEPMPLPSGLGWEEDLWRLAVWIRSSSQRHPHLAALAGEIGGYTDTLLAFGERWISLWRQSGVPEERVVEAALATLNGVVASIISAHPGGVSEAPQLVGMPNLRHAIISAPSDDELFELMVRSLVGGVHRRLTSGVPDHPQTSAAGGASLA